MNRYIRMIWFALILNTTFLSAQRVSENLISDEANKFISHYFPSGSWKIQSIIPYNQDTSRTLCIVDLYPEGWLLMGSDLRVEPVVGFSFTGEFKMPDKSEYNPMFNWFNSYSEHIEEIIRRTDLEKNKQWLQQDDLQKGLSQELMTIKPLISVNWDQGYRWNYFCPIDVRGPGNHVYTGCVAVSLAQAMSVFRSPVKGNSSYTYVDPKYGTQTANFGITDYHWNMMSAFTPDLYNSLLLFHCAVAVNTTFGVDGSGAPTSNVATALKKYFGFSQKIIYQRRTGTKQYWHDVLLNQLLSGRPVIYSGDADDGEAGHAFNIDGIMNDTYFHVNWGWNGLNNGYFLIDELNPGLDIFSKNQAAVLGIQPYHYPTGIVLSDTLVREYLPAGTPVGKIKVIDEAGDNSYKYMLKCDSSYNGSRWISNYFLDGSIVKTGRVFTAADQRIDTITLIISDIYNNKKSKLAYLKIESKEEETDASNSIKFFIYPNPAEERVFMLSSTPPGISTINVYSVSGAKMATYNISSYIEGFSVSELASGIYIIEAIFSDQKILRQKFIKK